MVEKIPDNEQAQYLPGRKIKPTKEQREYFDKRDSGRKLKGSSPLGTILEEAGLVSDDMIKGLLKDNPESAQSLKRALIQQGLVCEDDILDAMALEMGMEKVNLKSLTITKDLIDQIPSKIATSYKVFPVKYDDTNIQVALSDPLNIQTTDDLRQILGKDVVGVVASEEDIEKFLKKYYKGNEVVDLYDQATQELDSSRPGFSKYEEIDIDADTAIDAPPVVRFVDLIFKQAVHERASDIHIEPTRMGVTIRFRVDGVLHEIPSPPKKWQNAILSRLKVLSGMDLAEKRIPQDGRIKLNLPDRKLDLRVSALPAIHGESIVMRILDQSSVLLGLEDVGFLPDNIKIFKKLIKAPTGIILMTGPTGSGKTTTLYSALSTLNNPETKIITIENPVEYQLEGIIQIQVNEEIGLDFSKGLRSILRQSPDVLLVGEIRDLETAEIAIRSALTGHLVFSTLHTNDAPSATIRLMDMGIKPFLVASSIQAVIAQRLLRKICSHCKAPHQLTEADLATYGIDPKKYPDLTAFKGKGCDRCGQTGYRGRTAIHEVFVSDPEIRQMIIRCEPGIKLKKAAVTRKGMRTLRMDGLEKVRLGMTSVEEVFRITQTDVEY